MLPWWCTLISVIICMHWAPWTEHELWVFCNSDHFGGTRTHMLMKTAFWNRKFYGALSDYRYSKMWLHRVARRKWGDMRQKWPIWHDVMAIHLDIKLWDFILNNNVNCFCYSYLKCADLCLMTTWAQWQWKFLTTTIFTQMSKFIKNLKFSSNFKLHFLAWRHDPGSNWFTYLLSLRQAISTPSQASQSC